MTVALREVTGLVVVVVISHTALRAQERVVRVADLCKPNRGRLRLAQPVSREVEALLRSHIRYHMDLSLKSETFLRKLQAGSDGGQDATDGV